MVSKSLATPQNIAPRGNWMDESGSVVEPAFPSFCVSRCRLRPPLDPTRSGPLDRLEDNPLTARVFVNRLWKQLFGGGISKTLDDLAPREMANKS
jgi:hypothetical protein